MSRARFWVGLFSGSAGDIFPGGDSFKIRHVQFLLGVSGSFPSVPL